MKRKKSHRQWLAGISAAILTAFFAVAAVAADAPRHRVAVLTPGLSYDAVMLGLREELSRLGYQEGKNLAFTIEETKGAPPDAVKAAAMRLLESKPDVLFTVSTSHTAAAKQATTSVPVVFAWVGDPLRSGFIDSYASSKNNLTGVSIYSVPLSGKRLEIL
jgi:putative ABC transport system substrate-binding protein